MYARRIQIINYGPIGHLDIKLPFDDEDKPKPVVLVGENGSGKSILLSHIVNGLVAAKNIAYPRSPEVEPGTVFKVRAPSYIKSGCAAYFARVDFDDGMYISEIQASRQKRAYDGVPPGLTAQDAVNLWSTVKPHEGDAPGASLPRSSLVPSSSNAGLFSGLFTSRCVLYFPANRFDEPAWLNPTGLDVEAKHSSGHLHIDDTTTRKVVVSSMLSGLRDWILDVILDGAMRNSGEAQRAATHVLPAAAEVVGAVLGYDDARLVVGHRGSRIVGVGFPAQRRRLSLAHLSSGEMALIGLFLSIIRDYDLCDRPQIIVSEIKGIVVVDEIDLHLHVRHQHEVLPRLIKMFPKVQFIVTSHSPLFVLGMRNTFEDDGFDIYRLPDGHQINAEEFNEFGEAYLAFTDTRKHADKLRTAIEQANGPVLYFEGRTDVKYVKRAAKLLGRTELLASVDIQHASGAGNLEKAWGGRNTLLAARISSKVVLVADCDTKLSDADRGMLVVRKVPKITANPVKRGIENLFSQETLQKAQNHDPNFVKKVITTKRDLQATEPVEEEEWILDDAWKSALCDWLCEHGTKDDFQHFEAVFNMLEAVLRQANDGDAPAQG